MGHPHNVKRQWTEGNSHGNKESHKAFGLGPNPISVSSFTPLSDNRLSSHATHLMRARTFLLFLSVGFIASFYYNNNFKVSGNSYFLLQFHRKRHPGHAKRKRKENFKIFSYLIYIKNI